MRHSSIEHAPDHIRHRLGGQDHERRTYGLASQDLRGVDDADAKTWLFEGAATVFDVGYEMYGGPSKGGWTEYVDSGSADKTLSERADVQLNINHAAGGGMPLARTKSGTLRLSAASSLDVSADLEPTDPGVLRLAPKLRRRDMDEMSFAFTVVRHEWDDDYTERHIKEVNLHKGDVSIVNYGANDSTWANDLRSAMDLIVELTAVEPDELLAEMRSAGATDPVSLLTAARDHLNEVLRTARPPAPAQRAAGIPLEQALA